ncbi:glyceraldehyde-3-phosphate dehydrogenase [Colwellia echini]|uniref:Glyceraldehyde-3-phosphate dehydrogenase n=1 Tax=Colwellia echini TaxID=1982103 RepID=A0ABY3N0T2_9GAMM|nr:glyceraldehyde-3-phosphate dehydrogenase [Colwellia echini]TYK66847.1 glyceraldehyde-3-phosphate dehydrogenase [Colwellia echini]
MDSHPEENYQVSWQERQTFAENMQPKIGLLFRNKGIEILVYGRTLLNASAIDIIKAHKAVTLHEDKILLVRESFPFIDAINNMKLAPARIDVGKLAYNYYHSEKSGGLSVSQYLAQELDDIIDQAGTINNSENKRQDVVLYGFGRIGRVLARLLIERSGPNSQLNLRAIVLRPGKSNDDIEKRASLLRRDSVHGAFNGSISIDKERNVIRANGAFIKVIYAKSPAEIDYTEHGIENALVVDNTGIWTDEVGLSQHLQAKGVAKVLLTAPAKGDIKNIVFGVNQEMILATDKIISAASCTTNAITPVLKAINDEFGIRNGHVETIHSYTNDQNLIDNYHPAPRRGRSAPLNMVISTTGAAQAVAKALPELKGLLTGNAIRVPTPNVSLAIMNLNLKKLTDKASLNDYLRTMSLKSPLQNQIDYTASNEIVSTDLVGSRYAGVVDSQATIVDEDRAVLYVWYDNEFGYSCQVMQVMLEMAGITVPNLPK